MKCRVSVEVELHDWGVEPPSLKGVKFFVHRELQDDEGVFSPIDGEGTYEGALQINFHTDSDGYRALGCYFLGLAEFDVGGDPCFHAHHEGLLSADGKTRLHIICRKDDSRYEAL